MRKHQKLMTSNTGRSISWFIFTLIVAAAFSSCTIVKKSTKTPTLLKTENATQDELMKEINRFASVNSMRAKMDLKFEDNSFAQFGSKEEYRTADGEVVVQRPANILLKVQVPVIKTDVAQMTSDGTSFRVAVLNCGGGAKCKKFIKGTNTADYSKLEKSLDENDIGSGAALKNVSSFVNLRPQHFTEALLVKPTDAANIYVVSTIFQVEDDDTQARRSPLRQVMRGYYLLDEFTKQNDGGLKITRRFWFDRVGGIRLARQQIFDARSEIESDIVYGKQGNLTDTGNYNNLPLRIQVTRPKEKYTMSLTYQTPELVTIGKNYPQAAFVLQNTWGLDEVDLDQKLQQATAGRTDANKSNTAAHP